MEMGGIRENGLKVLITGNATTGEGLQPTKFGMSPVPSQAPASDAELIHVYTHELYQLGYGLPMWDPQPFQKVVDIGDLGFVNQHGSFVTLFNVTIPAEEQQYPLPPGFQPFSLSRINTMGQSISRPYLSSGIHVVEDGPECSKINWEIRRGSILIIKDPPTKLSVHHGRPLQKYIELHQDEWYRFLEEHKDCPTGVINDSKLLLVTGIYRTNDWSLGAWSSSLAQRSLTYTRVTTNTTPIGWLPHPAPGIRDRVSPRPQQYAPIHDFSTKNIGTDSLFLEGFRISRRSRQNQDVRTGIQADADFSSRIDEWDWLTGGTEFQGPSNETHSPTPQAASLPPPSPATGHSSGPVVEPRHPLDNLSDHIFSTFPNVHTTVVHDRDLLELKHLSNRHGRNANHFYRNIVHSGTCAFFGFSSFDIPFHDLGPIIVNHAAQFDVATARNLALTCRQFYQVCNPLLYYSVHLSTAKKFTCFIRTLSNSPGYAQYVRHIIIQQTSIPSSTGWFTNFDNLLTVAIFSFCHKIRGRKASLPPSVAHIACDPCHFVEIERLSPDKTFQHITHLHLLTRLPLARFWNWLGRLEAPILTHLAVEHHVDISLEDASQQLTPLVKKYLGAHIRLCVIMILNHRRFDSMLDQNSIALSDGSVDDRVVLATEFIARSSKTMGYFLRVDIGKVRKAWRDSPYSAMWLQAEKVRKKRKLHGKLPLESYEIDVLIPATPQA
ncbi:hypothetical protein DL96DRAFT_1816605 [Flagelloscypha sp. PMI_526]|nr:hypothetical protein DL96DRAFT_1816605 [Flagelloscypha sp. PMI_526]